METIQNILTVAIEVVAIAGFGGIALHAIWANHCKWMATYCPPVEPEVVEPEVVEPEVVELCISHIFRKESQKVVTGSKLELVGVTAI